MPIWTKVEHSESDDGGQVWPTLWLGFLSILLYLSAFLNWLTPLPLLYGFKKGGWSLVLGALGVAFLILLVLYLGVIPKVELQWGGEGVAKYLFWIPGVAYSQGTKINPLWFGLPYFLYYSAMGSLLGYWEDRILSINLLVGRTLGILVLGIFIWVLWQSGGNLKELVASIEVYFSGLMDQIIATVTQAGRDSQGQLVLFSRFKDTFLFHNAPQLMDQMIATANQAGRGAQEQLAFFDRFKDSILFYAVRLIPAMMVCMIIFVLWLNIVVARKFFVKYAFFQKLGPLSEWRLPFFMVWILIGMALFLLLDHYFLHSGFFKLLALNAFIIFGMVYFFQGLSILVFFSKRWSLSPWMKFIFYFLFFIFFQPIGILLLMFGFFDSWFDFRKMVLKKE